MKNGFKKIIIHFSAVTCGLAVFGLAFSSAFALEWKSDKNGSYWYENGVRQGVYGSIGNVWYDNIERGREIYDPASNGWYWLDACYDGAKAVNKEVFMPYVYSDEHNVLSDLDSVKRYALLSNKTAEIVAKEGGEVVDLSSQVYSAILAHGNNGSGKWVRYDSEGKMVKGWYKVKGLDEQLYPEQIGNVYYYDRQTGLMAKGDVCIDGINYSFDTVSGKLISGNEPDFLNCSEHNWVTSTKKETIRQEEVTHYEYQEVCDCGQFIGDWEYEDRKNHQNANGCMGWGTAQIEIVDSPEYDKVVNVTRTYCSICGEVKEEIRKVEGCDHQWIKVIALKNELAERNGLYGIYIDRDYFTICSKCGYNMPEDYMVWTVLCYSDEPSRTIHGWGLQEHYLEQKNNLYRKTRYELGELICRNGLFTEVKPFVYDPEVWE